MGSLQRKRMKNRNWGLKSEERWKQRVDLTRGLCSNVVNVEV
jgi:hypothetical protein